MICQKNLAVEQVELHVHEHVRQPHAAPAELWRNVGLHRGEANLKDDPLTASEMS